MAYRINPFNLDDKTKRYITRTALLGSAYAGWVYGSPKGSQISQIVKKSKNKILSSNNMAFKYRKGYRSRSTYRKRGGSKHKTSGVSAFQVSKYSSQKNGQTVYNRKAYKQTSRKPTPLFKQIKEIKRQLSTDTATHTYKRINSNHTGSAIGQCNHTFVGANDITNLEAAMANLRYYNPSVPGTLTTANASTGTYARRVLVENMYGQIQLHNHYQVPCKVKIYICYPKGDTSIDPVTYYNNGLTDQVIGGASDTTAGLYMTEILAVKEQWRVRCLKDVILDAGATCIATHTTGPFEYDPALADSHNLTYQSKYKAFCWVIRVEGVLGHDTVVASEQALMQAHVDYETHTKFVFKYDAGVNLDDIYLNDTRDSSFTNAGVVSSKPVSDNI